MDLSHKKEYGETLEELSKKLDSGNKTEEVIDDMKTTEDDDYWEEVNEALYAVLLDKAEADVAYKKVQSVARGEGLLAYAKMYTWFTEVSGMGLMEQARKLMHPDAPKKEEDIATAFEEWEEKCGGWRHTVRSMSCPRCSRL